MTPQRQADRCRLDRAVGTTDVTAKEPKVWIC